MKRLSILSVIACFVFFTSCEKDNSDTSAASLSTTTTTSVNNLRAVLQGDSEVPTHSSNASGVFDATYDPASRKLNYTLTYTTVPGTQFTPTATHIHRGEPGVDGNAIVIFDLPVTPSPIRGSVTLSQEQISEMQNSKYYVHMHSSIFPDGDIRGQIRVK